MRKQESKKLAFVIDNFEAIQNWLERVLPHGSGIDCDWSFDYQQNGIVKASNAYNCMNENGFYCGYADFTVKVDLAKPEDFVLQFNGKLAAKLNDRHILRDYLEETIHYALTNVPETLAQYIEANQNG